MRFTGRVAVVVTALAAAGALHAASGGVDATGERRLQPFGERDAGRHVDAADLARDAGPAAGTRRSARWREARETGLEALVVSPATRRGAYRDLHAVHAAWDAPAR